MGDFESGADNKAGVAENYKGPTPSYLTLPHPPPFLGPRLSLLLWALSSSSKKSHAI